MNEQLRRRDNSAQGNTNDDFSTDLAQRAQQSRDRLDGALDAIEGVISDNSTAFLDQVVQAGGQ